MDSFIDSALFTQAGFTQADNKCFYANIGGFLYTVSLDDKHLLLAVNLPSVNKNERRMVSCYIKENIALLERQKFVKDGLYLYFDLKSFIKDEPNIDYINDFTQKLSSFLVSIGIEFSNAELNMAFNKKMYVFKPIAEPLNNSDESVKIEETPSAVENSTKFKRFMLTPESALVLLAVCGIVFFILVVKYVKLAAVMGYITGWLVCFLFSEQKKNRLFLRSMLVSSAMLILVGAIAFLVMFLSQSEFYSVFDYAVRTLDLYHCIFSVGLGIILAAFGVYSTVPPKKSAKQVNPEDF